MAVPACKTSSLCCWRTRSVSVESDHVEFIVQMLNNITNDLDLLLSDFCHLTYPETEEPTALVSTPMRTNSKKPMQLENCSAFGGSSTSGTLTSTDSNHSHTKDVPSGTLTSTDSNNSFTKPRSISNQSGHHVDVFGLTNRGLGVLPYPERQSGSLSPQGSDTRQITVLERLTKTHPIWFLPECGRTGAVHLLKDKEIGIFLVRKSSREEVMALSVQFPAPEGLANVDHYLIEPTGDGFHLQGSYHLFKGIPQLISYYCDHKEDLPHKLVLPPAVRKARTSQELAALAMLGQDFWTSTRYEGSSRGNSRTSSRSNLSEHSINKSTSEPINIAGKSTVPTPYSQSETAIKNSPPKHSVIDFSSYLIQKRTEKTDMCTSSHQTGSIASFSEGVPSRCSSCEIKQSNHVTSSHVTTSQVSSTFTHNGESTHSELLLHQIEKDVDLQVSPVMQVLPPKVSPKSKSNLYFTTSLDLLNLPDELYFTSNLSDKLSDYEDIWKSSGPSSVQADIQSRLKTNINAKCVATSDRVSKETVPDAEDFVSLETFTAENKCVSQETVILNKCSSSEFHSSSSLTEVSVTKATDPRENGCALASESPLHNNLNCELCEEKDLHKDDSQKMSGFEPIPEQESDLDSDSCHSDSCHSADADTEEGEVKCASVHTQTSPVTKCKPPPLPVLPKKSASTSSLAAMKSPVYSEPFDAINIDSKDLESAPKLPKKIRRRSAPAVGMYRRKLGTSVYPKLTPLLSPGLEGQQSSITDQTGFDKLDLQDDSVHESFVENTVVAPCSPKRVESSPLSQQDFLPNRKILNEVANRKAKEKEKQKNVQNDTVTTKPPVQNAPPTTCSRQIIDQLQLMEDFESSNHGPSSPTLNKFPVYGKHTVTENKRLSYTENSTVEDIITTWNPELSVKPIQKLPALDRLGPMSEYDNLARGTEYIAPSWQTTNSVGTIFCKPWDSSVWGKIMNAPTEEPPPLPPPLDPQERIRAWQESSQNFQNVPTDTEDDRRQSVISDTGSADTKTCHGDPYSISEVHVASNGLTSQSDKTLVNEKLTSRPSRPTDSAVDDRGRNADDSPLFGADFREKVVPVLAYPRLLKQSSRNRSPDAQIREYIIRLSNDSNTTFGCTIANFIQCTLESQDTNPFHVTRNVRQFMNGIRNYLVKHGEGELEDLIERERNKLQADEILNIDAIIESALHECVLHPLKQNLYRLFVNEYTVNGNLKLLSSNIKYARTKTPEEIGVRRGLSPPDGPMLEQIKQYLTNMQKSYSPLKKLENLLGATSSIYKCVAGKNVGNGSQYFGADDFLPMLIYVLIQSGMVSVEIEADYMWGLLHPSLLTGEGGYYLTSLSSAVLVLKNFREMQETKTSQQEGKLPSISDMQGFLKLAIPDELRDTIVWKTLPVRPSMTTKDVCSMIAHKFKITNPQDYGLYALENGEERKLADNECPQVLKADCFASSKECVFAYKRNAANIAWPKSVKGI